MDRAITEDDLDINTYKIVFNFNYFNELKDKFTEELGQKNMKRMFYFLKRELYKEINLFEFFDINTNFQTCNFSTHLDFKELIIHELKTEYVELKINEFRKILIKKEKARLKKELKNIETVSFVGNLINKIEKRKNKI